MKLNNKEYQTIKIKKFLKKDKLFFFFNGVSRNSNDWKKTEQILKVIKFNVFKIFNKITYKKLQNSIFKNMKEITSGPTFLIKSAIQAKLMKDVLLTKLYLLLFLLIAVKVNNKVYPIIVLKKNTNLIHYVINSLLFYQFSLTFLKSNKKLFCSKVEYSK